MNIGVVVVFFFIHSVLLRSRFFSLVKVIHYILYLRIGQILKNFEYKKTKKNHAKCHAFVGKKHIKICIFCLNLVVVLVIRLCIQFVPFITH